MNILKRELKFNFLPFVFWTASLSILVVWIMYFYPSIAKSGETVNELINKMPSSMIKAFGMDKMSMTNIIGYYGSKAGILVVLSISIYAMLLAGGMLAKEQDDKTMEFLLSKPVTRNEVLTQKIACYSIYIVLINVILFAATYFSFEWVKTKNYSVNTLFTISFGYFLVEFTFSSIALIVSVFAKRRKSITSLSIWLVLLMYFLSAISSISDKLSFLKNITPFSYVDVSDIMKNGAINNAYIVILVAVNIVCILASYIIYNKKDIQA